MIRPLLDSYDLEYTDTFGGETNYSWVKRKVLTISSANDESVVVRKRYDAKIKRLAKSLIGLAGIRGDWRCDSEVWEFRPRGMCTILFVTWHYCIDRQCEHNKSYI